MMVVRYGSSSYSRRDQGYFQTQKTVKLMYRNVSLAGSSSTPSHYRPTRMAHCC